MSSDSNFFQARIFCSSLKVDEFLRPGLPEGEDDACVVNGARVGGVVVACGRSHRWLIVPGPLAVIIVVLVILCE